MNSHEASALEKLTQASYARSFGEIQQELISQQAHNSEERISTSAEILALGTETEELAQQLKLKQHELSAANTRRDELNKQQAILQQQELLIKDYQALAENQFKHESAHFFTCSEEQFLAEHNVSKEKLQSALKSATETGIISIGDQCYCSIKTPNGQVFFHSKPVDKKTLFPEPQDLTR